MIFQFSQPCFTKYKIFVCLFRLNTEINRIICIIYIINTETNENNNQIFAVELNVFTTYPSSYCFWAIVVIALPVHVVVVVVVWHSIFRPYYNEQPNLNSRIRWMISLYIWAEHILNFNFSIRFEYFICFVEFVLRIFVRFRYLLNCTMHEIQPHQRYANILRQRQILFSFLHSLVYCMRFSDERKIWNSGEQIYLHSFSFVCLRMCRVSFSWLETLKNCCKQK